MDNNTNTNMNQNINYNSNNASNENVPLGIVGALIGALVGLIPTILLYLIGFFSYAGGLCLGYASVYGYNLLKGPDDFKKKKIIVLVSSIICITVCMLVFVPMIELKRQGINPTYLAFYYSFSEIVRTTVINYILALIFTVAGVVGFLKRN